MILAVSRFRVANGMEEEVRDAFVNRPHFVDSVRGFLGMETYTDKTNATIFYLVTRWSDDESFRTWHRSKEHHESHRFIPKGLKLDGSYTQVIELPKVLAIAYPQSSVDVTVSWQSPSGEGKNVDPFQRVTMVLPGGNTAPISCWKKSESVSGRPQVFYLSARRRI